MASHRHESQEVDPWKPSQKDHRVVLSIDLGKEHAAVGKSKCKEKGMFE